MPFEVLAWRAFVYDRSTFVIKRFAVTGAVSPSALVMPGVGISSTHSVAMAGESFVWKIAVNETETVDGVVLVRMSAHNITLKNFIVGDPGIVKEYRRDAKNTGATSLAGCRALVQLRNEAQAAELRLADEGAEDEHATGQNTCSLFATPQKARVRCAASKRARTEARAGCLIPVTFPVNGQYVTIRFKKPIASRDLLAFELTPENVEHVVKFIRGHGVEPVDVYGKRSNTLPKGVYMRESRTGCKYVVKMPNGKFRTRNSIDDAISALNECDVDVAISGDDAESVDADEAPDEVAVAVAREPVEALHVAGTTGHADHML